MKSFGKDPEPELSASAGSKVNHSSILAKLKKQLSNQMQTNQMEANMCEYLFGHEESTQQNLSAKDKLMTQKVFKTDEKVLPQAAEDESIPTNQKMSN
jgi:hypothetical protein